MTVGSLRVASVVIVLLGLATPVALGQSPHPNPAAAVVDLDQIPKHPIPYRLLRGHVAIKPKHPSVSGTQAAGAGPSPPGSPPPPAVAIPPGAGLTAHPTPAAASPPPAATVAAEPPGRPPLAASTPAPQPPSAAPALSAAAVPKSPPKPAPLPPPPPPLAAPQIGARLKPQDPLPAADLEAFVDGHISAGMALNHIHGMAIAVVQNGQLVLEKGYAGADAAPGGAIDPRSTLVRLGSTSQVLTWIAVLKAVEDGRLKLDDPVNAQLPEGLRVPDEGFDRPILLRHLLNHSAGFEDRALGRRYVQDPDRLIPLDEGLRRYRPRRVRAAGLLSVPSDYGAALAGAAAAKAEGMGFDQLIEAKILAPLGLSHTSFREPYPAKDGLAEPLDPRLAASVATGFLWTRQGLQPQPFAYGQSLAPSVSASTTADDMARLMIALLNGGKLGAVSLYNPATAALFGAPSQASVAGMLGWGHGFALKRLASGHLALFYPGSTLTFQSQLLLVPQLNLGVFVVADTNTAAADVANLAPALVTRFYGGKPTPPPTAAPLLSDVTGSYLSAQRTYHGLEAFADRLTLGSSVRLDPTSGALSVKGRRETKIFSPVGGDLFRAWDGGELFLSEVRDRAQAFILGSGGGAAQRIDLVHTLSFLASAAGAVFIASFASFTGMFTRDRTDQRETRSQTAANAVQIAASVLWCAALALFGLFVKDGVSPASLMFDWPNRWLVVASWAAVTASLLSLATAVQVPGVWREGRRIQGWSVWRKIRHTATVVLFLSFTALLAAWGALEPWSS